MSDHSLVQSSRRSGARRRGCERNPDRFRKACRSRFCSHLTATQKVPKKPRTTTEGPFGETLRATGPLANQNPFRFSSKFADDTTGLIYYGYRYYSPATGRWLGRDTVEEDAGRNLYLFALNRPASVCDSDGQWPTSLVQWTWYGNAATIANYGLAFSGIPGCEKIWGTTVTLINAINLGTSGALLRNWGGVGASLGYRLPGVDNLFLSAARPFANAALSARLAAVSVVGSAIGNILSGKSPSNPDSTGGIAYSFVQNSRQGNSAYADLDAALLGLSIAVDRMQNSLLSVRGGASLLSALLTKNPAAIAAYLPSYTALNAWDMLSDMETGLEGQ